MGRYKCAYSCKNSSDSDIKCFKFPLYNPRKLKKWLSNMKLTDWTPTRFSVLCIDHFEEKYINRSGQSPTLKDNAIPTIFSDNTIQNKTSVSPRRRNSKKSQPPATRASKKSSAQSGPPTPTTAKQSTTSTEQEPLIGTKKSENWRIIVDEGLMQIKSFPHFFHGDYCVPQNIQWAPDDNFSTEHKDPENMIEVTEAWQWLGLDVRGPLPQTLNGHKYVLTVTDFHSKWVEAVPMQTCLPPDVAKNIVDIISYFGYPLRILSRLPHDIVHKINRELKDHLNAFIPLMVYHQQTGTIDTITPELIDRMVGDLIEQHVADWDVYLPAQVFSLCFKEHSLTKERPVSALCCKRKDPVRSPRGLTYTYSEIQESVFVIR